MGQRNADYEALEILYRKDIEKLESTLIRINLENQALTNEFSGLRRQLDDTTKQNEQFRMSLDSESAEKIKFLEQKLELLTEKWDLMVRS